MREKINVKTGGKLYIAGEYSVLTPEQSAIIKNIDIFMNAEISFLGENEARNDEKIEVADKSKEKNDFKKYEIFSDMFDYSVSLEYDKNYSLIQETVVVVNEYLENKGIDTQPFKLRITGKMEKNGKKYGIGSSGSVTVLVVKAMFELYSRKLVSEAEFKGQRSELLEYLSSKDTMFKLSSYVLLKRGDNGSMGDIACIAYGNLVVYRSFDREKIQKEIREKTLEKVLELDWGYEIEELKCSGNYEFLVGWTKKPSISKDMINLVKSSINQNFLKKVEKIVQNLKLAMKNDNKMEIKRNILENGNELKKLKEEIYSEELVELVEATENLDVCAKSSGSGGGDCGIAISFSKKDGEILVERWKSVGIELLYKSEL